MTRGQRRQLFRFVAKGLLEVGGHVAALVHPASAASAALRSTM
jgi:hypothetical protein